MTVRKQSWIGRGRAAVLVGLQTFAGFAVAAAQDIKVEINPPSSGGMAWYQTWWVWVLVALFVIIIVVAITSRGKTARG